MRLIEVGLLTLCAPAVASALCIFPHCPCDMIRGTSALDVRVEAVYQESGTTQFSARIDRVIHRSSRTTPLYAVGDVRVFNGRHTATCAFDDDPPSVGDRRVVFATDWVQVPAARYLAPDPPTDDLGRPRHYVVEGAAAQVVDESVWTDPPIRIAALPEILGGANCEIRLPGRPPPPCNDTGTAGSEGCTASPRGGPAWPWLALMLGWIWRRRRAQSARSTMRPQT